eukprot:gene5908-8151_t
MNQLKVADEKLYASSPVVTLADEYPNGNKPTSILYFLQEIFRAYKDQLKFAPIRTKSITSLTIAILGEIFGTYIRCKINKTKFKLDMKRLRVFGLYGFFITGPVLHWWYQLLEQIVTRLDYHGNSKLFLKVFIDRVIFGPPFVLFTVIFLQFLQTLDVRKTIENVKRCYFDVLKTNECLWTVAQAINFKLIPVDFQVLFVNAVSIGWNTYLSLAS